MIIDVSKKKKLAKTTVILRSTAKKAKGLMFHPGLKDEGYVFVFDRLRHVSFHMMFVFFSIDMLFLDQNKRVLEIKRAVKPFTPNIRSKAKYVVELPVNATADVSIGDIISFK